MTDPRCSLHHPFRCIACGKPLTKYAVSIPTKDGPVGWGPKCAKRVVIKRDRLGRRNVTVKPRPVKTLPRDPAQVDWLEACGVAA